MNTKNLISKHDLGQFSYHPQYSILLCNQPLQAYEKQISLWLSQGIKVIGFSRNQETLLMCARSRCPHTAV